MLGLRQAGATKKCVECRQWLGLEKYGTNARTEKLYTMCETCRPKVNARMVAHYNTDAGKAAKKQYERSDAGKAKIEQYRQSDAGKARTKRYQQSEKGKAAEKRYWQSEKGKAERKRYRSGDAGKTAIERGIAKRQERRQASPAMRLAQNIKSLANHILAGDIETSPTFLRHTAFKSERQFRAHMKAECKKRGLKFKARSTWEIDRKIPVEAYDFDNREDVLRCWSPANITALTPLENQEKHWKLIDSWIHSAGPACFPLAWQNRMPTDEMRKAHDERMIATKSVGEQIETPASNESEEDEESEKDESEEDEFDA